MTQQAGKGMKPQHGRNLKAYRDALYWKKKDSWYAEYETDVAIITAVIKAHREKEDARKRTGR